MRNSNINVPRWQNAQLLLFSGWQVLGLGYPMPQIYPMIARTEDAPAQLGKEQVGSSRFCLLFLWFELINFLKASGGLIPVQLRPDCSASLALFALERW